MKKQPIHIQCLYTNKEEVQKVLMRSFRLYLSRSLAEKQSGAG